MHTPYKKIAYCCTDEEDVTSSEHSSREEEDNNTELVPRPDPITWFNSIQSNLYTAPPTPLNTTTSAVQSVSAPFNVDYITPPPPHHPFCYSLLSSRLCRSYAEFFISRWYPCSPLRSACPAIRDFVLNVAVKCQSGSLYLVSFRNFNTALPDNTTRRLICDSR